MPGRDCVRSHSAASPNPKFKFKVQIPTNVETNERDKTSENNLRKQTEEINKVSQSPAINLNEDKSLEELIKENSCFCCDICDSKSKSKKGLRIHTVKSHSVGSVNDNHKVLVRFGGGIKEHDKIKYIKCNICGFQKEDTGYNDKTHNVQSYREIEEHVKTEQKGAFDDGVLE